MEILAPPPTLAPFVRRIKAYAERDTDFVRRRELPTGRAVLLFNFGGELRIETENLSWFRARPPGALVLRPNAVFRISRAPQKGVWPRLSVL